MRDTVCAYLMAHEAVTMHHDGSKKFHAPIYVNEDRMGHPA